MAWNGGRLRSSSVSGGSSSTSGLGTDGTSSSTPTKPYIDLSGKKILNISNCIIS